MENNLPASCVQKGGNITEGEGQGCRVQKHKQSESSHICCVDFGSAQPSATKLVGGTKHSGYHYPNTCRRSKI